MVGPGTGLAPFRSLLLDQKEREIKRKSILFFGCRNEKKDFHCKDDLQLLEKNGNCCIFTAFSRDQDEKM